MKAGSNILLHPNEKENERFCIIAEHSGFGLQLFSISFRYRLSDQFQGRGDLLGSHPLGHLCDCEIFLDSYFETFLVTFLKGLLIDTAFTNIGYQERGIDLIPRSSGVVRHHLSNQFHIQFHGRGNLLG